MNYNIGCKFNLLKRWDDEEYLINEFLDLELFYQVNNELFYVLKFYKGDIQRLEIKFIDSTFEFNQKMIGN